ncbi:hypothetical protein GCM10020218_082430 [Dactylosporangium vinaceum]
MSVSTVANVLNNPGVVAVATRERVEAAMDRVGFVRGAAARQLRGLPSRLVGSITLDQGNPFHAELNRGNEDHLDEAGCMLLACSTDQRADRELRALQLLEEHSPRGHHHADRCERAAAGRGQRAWDAGGAARRAAGRGRPVRGGGR